MDINVNLNGKVTFDATPALIGVIYAVTGQATGAFAESTYLPGKVEAPTKTEEAPVEEAPKKTRSRAKVEPKVEEPAPAQEEKQSESADEEDSQEITAEMVRTKAFEIRDRGANEKTAVKELLREYGGKLSLIPEDKLVEFYNRLDEI